MPPLSPHLTSQSVYLPSSRTPAAYHVFFITGNPGCIGYYHTFLSLLSEAVLPESVDVYGRSLANFVDGTSEGEHSAGTILGLQAQIDYVDNLLDSYVSTNIVRARTRSPPKVILVGHSVGAYIGLEILRRQRLKEGKELEEQKMQIVGYVGLWPTITWIGRSPSGRKLGWMARIPHVANVVGALVRGLSLLAPRDVLCRIVEYFTKMPEDAAEVTMQFLSSHRGVEQALHMARDEMLEITEDRWDDDIWGTASALKGSVAPKIIFYFGQSDHWVADHTRDQLIASRGNVEGEDEPWKPKMLIDDEGIPHGFCIRHSSIAARKTAGFVREIIQADQIRHATPT